METLKTVTTSLKSISLTPRKTTTQKTPVELEQAMWDKYYDIMGELDRLTIPSLMPNANSYLIKRSTEISLALGADMRELKHKLVEKVKRVEKAYSGWANSNKRNDEISRTTVNYLIEVINRYKKAIAEMKEAIEESKA